VKGQAVKLDAAGKVTHAAKGIPVSPSLDRLWSLLHLSLSMGSASGASTIDGDIVSHGKPSGRAPDGGSSFELRDLERRWEGCRTKVDREAVLRDAITAYKQQTIPNADPRKKRGTVEWKEAIANDLRPCREVAQRWAVKPETVLKFRREFLADPPRPGRPRQKAAS
jgi:hypothetical protein